MIIGMEEITGAKYIAATNKKIDTENPIQSLVL
jgi:hypothetical protein